MNEVFSLQEAIFSSLSMNAVTAAPVGGPFGVFHYSVTQTAMNTWNENYRRFNPPKIVGLFLQQKRTLMTHQSFLYSTDRRYDAEHSGKVMDLLK